MDKNFLTPNEASKIAGVTHATIRNWCVEFHIGLRIGRFWRIDPEKLNEILKGTYEKKKYKKNS